MAESPFRFLDSPVAVTRLHRRLAAIGLSSDENATVTESPLFTSLRYHCAWLRVPVDIHWHFRYWPDGEHAELARIRILHGNALLEELEVAPLQKRAQAGPLPEILIDWVVACCARLTGKHC